MEIIFGSLALFAIIAFFYFYVRNIVYLVKSDFNAAPVMSIARIVGIFIPLLGVIMGCIEPK